MENLQLMQENLRAMMDYAEMINKRIDELNTIMISLTEYTKLEEKEQEILVPVVGGIYFEAKTTPRKDAMINVGSKTLVKKPITEIMKGLNKELLDLEKAYDETNSQINNIMHHMNKKKE